MIILFHPCKIWWNKLGSCNKDGWLQQDTINLDGKKKIEKNLQAFFLPFISKLFILIGDSSDLMRRRIPTKIRRQRPGCRWLRGRVSLTQPSSLTFLGITWLQQSATTTSSSFQQTSCRQKHHKWGKKEKKKNHWSVWPNLWNSSWYAHPSYSLAFLCPKFWISHEGNDTATYCKCWC